MTIQSHPEHADLGYAERGDREMLGHLSSKPVVGHWHRHKEPGRAETRSWVSGIVEACNERHSGVYGPASVASTFDVPVELLGQPTTEQIAAAFEHGDPTPEGLADEVIQIVRPEQEESPHGLPGVHSHLTGASPYQVVKPERGGKRSCVTTFADGEAYCGHSESRHNASGTCRSCDCTTFMVEA